MVVFYRVENQAGERVGVENHPGSDYSGRQCRPLKGVVREVEGKIRCGLDIDDNGEILVQDETNSHGLRGILWVKMRFLNMD